MKTVQSRLGKDSYRAWSSLLWSGFHNLLATMASIADGLERLWCRWPRMFFANRLEGWNMQSWNMNWIGTGSVHRLLTVADICAMAGAIEGRNLKEN